MQKILVIKLGALGDFIQSLGAMKAIRAHHRHAHITLLTTRSFETFAQKSGYFDSIKLDERPKFYQPQKWLSLHRYFKDQQFDCVYDLQNNDRTSFYFRILPSPKPDWVGVAKGASHRNTSPERTQGLAFYGHKQTLALAGIDTVEIDTLDWISADIDGFGLKTPYVLIVPGSAPTRPLKRWPAQYYAQLCQKLVADGQQPVLIGTKDEQSVTQEIEESCPGVLNLNAQTSLFDLAVLGRHAYGCVTNDTGPAHMIAPTGCKTLVLFSNDSNPVRHAPLGEHVSTLQKDSLADLKVEEVYSAFSSLTGAP